MPRAATLSVRKRKPVPTTGDRPGPKTTRAPKRTKMSRDDQLRMLLADDYWVIVEDVMRQDPALVEMITQYIHSHRSTYTPMAEAESPVAYFKRHQMTMVNVIHLLTTVGHQQGSITPWKVMRSIAALKEKTRRVQYDTGVREGNYLHRSLLQKTLKQIKALKPPRDMNISPHIAKNCSDQLNVWRGATKRRMKREVERAGADGKKVKVESNTLLMMVDHPVDHDKFHMTNEDAMLIKENGPCTEHYTEIYKHLNWDVCQDQLYETMDDFTAQVVKHITALNNDGDNPPELQFDDILILMSRPDHNPGESNCLFCVCLLYLL